jgi:hypothetical protein
MVRLVGERVINGPKTASELLMQAMAELRTIGAAVESYAIDNGSYPPQSKGLQTVDFVSSMASLVYIRNVPVKDPWDNEFLYWSDQTEYIIVSTGADGILNRPYSIEPGWLAPQKFVGEYADPGEDMVFSNGRFAQWPRRGGM